MRVSIFLVLTIVWPVAVSAQTMSNMQVLSEVNEFPGTYNDVWGYTAPDGTELAILGTVTGTAFYDVTIPTDPVPVGFISAPCASIWRDMKTYGTYCYVVSECGHGLQVIDLSDPQSPVEVNVITDHFQTAHNLSIDVDEGRAYIAGGNTGIVIYDLAADPVDPPALGAYTRRYAHDLHVQRGIGYCAMINDRHAYILDFTTPGSVQEVTNWTYPGALTHTMWANEDATLAVTTDEVSGGHLIVWDITGSSAQALGNYIAPNDRESIHNAFIRGELCYTSYYSEGVRVVSLADPEDPVEVGFFKPPSLGNFIGMWGVYPFATDPGIVYASDMARGLYVLRFEGAPSAVEPTTWGSIKAVFMPPARSAGESLPAEGGE